jgi:Tol biopolymer transport system component
MRFIFLIFFSLITSIKALDVTITDGQHVKINILYSLGKNHQLEQEISQKIIKNFGVLDRVNFYKTEFSFQNFAQYRDKKMDFLLSLEIIQEKSNQLLNIKMLSPWGASADTAAQDWPIFYERSYQIKKTDHLTHIANQITDDIADRIICVKGFASYPLAYIYKSKDNTYSIKKTDITGDLEEVLYQSQNPLISLVWAPDAKKLAFVELTKNGPSIKIIDRYTKKISLTIKDQYVAAPMFSKDNRFIFYISAPTGIGQVFKRDLITGGIECLTLGQDWVSDINPGFDEYHLILSTNRSGLSQLYEFNTINKKYKRLTFSDHHAFNGILSQENQAMFYLAFNENEHRMRLLKRSFIDKNYDEITTEGYVESPVLAPAQSLIAYEQQFENESLIKIQSLFTLKEFVLKRYTDGSRVSSPSWASQPGE